MTIITVFWEGTWVITGKLIFSTTTFLKVFSLCTRYFKQWHCGLSFYSWSSIWRVV